ncbi:MAG TPA: NUDIX hydrolase [Burkholderiaceae bacterium]|jgi:ADP-ribose pyrophosphatase|nr:NUDIX hydrolase [Burkholderiaceae bacterium]
MPHRTRRIDQSAAAASQDTGALGEVKLHARLAYDGGMLRLHRDIVRCPDGHVAYREFVRHPGAVMTIPMLDPDHVILERQFRYPLGRVFIEFPAGKIDPGEGLLQCAQRELLEETGYRAGDWTHLGAFHNAIGYSDERIDIFLARALEPDTTRRDPGEVLELFSVRWRELEQWVRDGRITDGKTIVGIYWMERLLGAG